MPKARGNMGRHYRGGEDDTGCEDGRFPSCLECPLPECRHDREEWTREERRGRYDQKYRESHREQNRKYQENNREQNRQYAFWYYHNVVKPRRQAEKDEDTKQGSPPLA